MAKTIPLSNGGEVTVDDADYGYLSQFSWRKKPSDGGKTFHAVRDVAVGNSRLTVRMHRLITEADADDRVEFRNGDGLDCRRRNLMKRRLTPWVGRPDTSGYRGVSQMSTNHYRAEIAFAGRIHVIGDEFSDGLMAAHAYDRVAKSLYGKQARTNF